jgi:hypothetical protein
MYINQVPLLTQGSGIFRRHSLHEEDPILQSFHPITIDQLACTNRLIILIGHCASNEFSDILSTFVQARIRKNKLAI